MTSHLWALVTSVKPGENETVLCTLESCCGQQRLQRAVYIAQHAKVPSMAEPMWSHPPRNWRTYPPIRCDL